MSILERFTAEYASQLEYHNYGWSDGKEASVRWILSRIGQGRVLDVGGTTRLLDQLHDKGNPCAYFDAFPPTRDVPYPVHTGDIHVVADFFPEASFEYVTLRHTLEHCLNPLLVLWQVNTLLVERGRLIVILPHHWSYWVWFYTHFNCLPLENWRMLFYRAGYRIVEETSGFWDAEQQDPHFVEYRFVLEVESRSIRLGARPGK